MTFNVHDIIIWLKIQNDILLDILGSNERLMLKPGLPGPLFSFDKLPKAVSPSKKLSLE